MAQLRFLFSTWKGIWPQKLYKTTQKVCNLRQFIYFKTIKCKFLFAISVLHLMILLIDYLVILKLYNDIELIEPQSKKKKAKKFQFQIGFFVLIIFVRFSDIKNKNLNRLGNIIILYISVSCVSWIESIILFLKSIKINIQNGWKEWRIFFVVVG